MGDKDTLTFKFQSTYVIEVPTEKYLDMLKEENIDSEEAIERVAKSMSEEISQFFWEDELVIIETVGEEEQENVN